jgi:hypothetical protein
VGEGRVEGKASKKRGKRAECDKEIVERMWTMARRVECQCTILSADPS